MGAEVSDRDCALALTPVSPEVAARLDKFVELLQRLEREQPQKRSRP